MNNSDSRSKHFVGGSLKLKKKTILKKTIQKLTTQPTQKNKIKKLQKKYEEQEKKETFGINKNQHSDELAKSNQIQMTEAEKKYHYIQACRENQRIESLLHSKTHREKIQDFNTRMEKLPEHFDIPRVGPG